MVSFTKTRLQEIMHRGIGRNIMVVGDLMIDRYLWGSVSRISPEAPVPIINIADEETRFGGAANVANNLIGLNAIPIVVGVVGQDTWGEVFRNKLREKGLTADGLITDPGRPTTLKTRIIGNNQHIARVDSEAVTGISPETVSRILSYVESVIGDTDAIILQDYNKGVMVPELIAGVIAIANRHGVRTTVDPKFDNFLTYRDVTLFKPNRKEAEEALAHRIDSEESTREAGRLLLEKLNAEAVLITLSEKGMALFQRNQQPFFEKSRARKVADVSGAGDTVIATITYALAAGATMQEAVSMANHAAGVVCGEVGVVPIVHKELIEAILHATSSP
ncbi:MAG: D-glycero-beta-D-manno-heptose-7-phosphate kinase [Calditrichaeota bacterium]|nr:D-glycero-beta-D-manno-heptose-7-phosphate kinase [Calditrichota bacterium]HQU73845.1 D-glycero-beta-D-manno-heptose-7-phosphate kinase [Calditrichia bacterium]